MYRGNETDTVLVFDRRHPKPANLGQTFWSGGQARREKQPLINELCILQENPVATSVVCKRLVGTPETGYYRD